MHTGDKKKKNENNNGYTKDGRDTQFQREGSVRRETTNNVVVVVFIDDTVCNEVYLLLRHKLSNTPLLSIFFH